MIEIKPYPQLTGEFLIPGTRSMYLSEQSKLFEVNEQNCLSVIKKIFRAKATHLIQSASKIEMVEIENNLKLDSFQNIERRGKIMDQ